MTNPTRILSSSIDANVQRWLKAGVEWRPAAGEQDRIWQSIASEVGAVAAGLTVAEAANEASQATATAAAAKSATVGLSNAASALSVGTGGAKVSMSVVALKAVGLGLGIGAALLVGGSAVTSHLHHPAAAVATAPAPTAGRLDKRLPSGHGPSQADELAQSPHEARAHSEPDSGASQAVLPARVPSAATPSRQGLPPLTTDQLNGSPAPTASTRLLQPLARSAPTEVVPNPTPSAPTGVVLDPTPSTSHDSIRQEIRLVSMARNALRQRQAASALTILREADQLYPLGLLGEERAVLRIEALVQSGRSSEALRFAERFLSRYPSSLNAGHVRDMVGDLHPIEQ